MLPQLPNLHFCLRFFTCSINLGPSALIRVGERGEIGTINCNILNVNQADNFSDRHFNYLQKIKHTSGCEDNTNGLSATSMAKPYVNYQSLPSQA